jgi:acetylornithine deacetylase/succinyl-diaminopimelate desuccinylase-like protein
VAITPPDRYGYKCAIVVVEHFSHFVQVYPAKDYSEETVCGVLIRHYATFGLFDEIVSDPGSSFLGAVVAKLNKIFGVSHRVTLVVRHESNGVEATNRVLLRHLTTLVFEKGLKDRWSEDEPLNERKTVETGRFTPFQLKYGTQDAERFKLPVNIDPEDKAAHVIRQLDEDLRVIRAASLKVQQEISK